MKKIPVVIGMALLLALALPVSAQTAEDIASYGIPADARRFGFPSRNRDQKMVIYLTPGAQETTEQTKIAVEQLDFKTDALLSRTLLKNGKKHGIQREWYLNGQLKSESPMREGVMDGTLKHWDELGQLVGQYEMKLGTGVVKIYDSQGKLITEEGYKNSQRDGIRINISQIEKIFSLDSYENGGLTGIGFGFYPNNNLHSVGISSKGELHGPFIEFNQDGALRRSRWYVNGQQMTEAEYIEAVAADPTLPPYYSDSNRYKEFVTPEIKALLEKYRTMPRVKIPLEFDANGEPRLAPPIPTPPAQKTP